MPETPPQPEFYSEGNVEEVPFESLKGYAIAPEGFEIKTALQAGLTWCKRSLVQEISHLVRRIGRIELPEGNPPQIETRNWLYIAFIAARKDDGIELIERWLLSPPGGWDEDIYEQIRPKAA